MKRRKTWGVWVKTAHDADDYVTINGARWFLCHHLPGWRAKRPRLCSRCGWEFQKGSSVRGYRPDQADATPQARSGMLLCAACVDAIPFAKVCETHEWRYLPAHSHFVWRRQCTKCGVFERKFKECRISFLQGMPEGTRDRKHLFWTRPVRGTHAKAWDALNPDPASPDRTPHLVTTQYPGGVRSGLWRARRRTEVQ